MRAAIPIPMPPNAADDAIRGVNLGGWLLLEPWITPSLFDIARLGLPQEMQPVDEYTLCLHLGVERATSLLRRHWDSFCTEADIAELARGGVTHLRIPVGYWALESADDEAATAEPWVRGAWEYAESALTWAARHNLRVLFDLHGVPGSQNGFDNSGRRGPIHWHTDPAYTTRALACVSRMAERLARHPDHGAVYGIQPVNEPAFWGLEVPRIRQYYIQSYARIRHRFPDPWSCAVVIHDAFLGLDAWNGFMQPADGFQNVVLDTHRYQMFEESRLAWTHAEHLQHAATFKSALQRSNANLWTIVGEWSLATTDCARWLNGHGIGSRWTGTHPSRADKGPMVPGASCDKDNNLSLLTSDDRQWLAQFHQTQADAYAGGHGWFFWTFKTEGNPAWDFLMGLRQGWIKM